MSTASPETSVVIRTFNEAKYLPGLLKSLETQSYRDFEIVLVDSGSMDGTREIAAAYAHKLLRIDSHDFTFGYSLNVGVDAASGSYAVLVSAHTLPVSNDWLRTLIEPLYREDTAMCYGRQLGWSTSKFSEALDLGRTFGNHRKVLHPPNFFGHNANSAIRKGLWLEHPFDEVLPGLEDIEWAKHWMLQGYQVVYNPEAALYHIHEEQWRQIQRRYYREAVAARTIGVKGKRHALLEPFREASLAVLDLGHAMGPTASIETVPGSRWRRPSEIMQFRAHKVLGTVKGLLDGTAMRDPVSRESYFFDRSSEAVVIHGPGRSSREAIPIAEIKPGEVLIRTAYCGVSGTDFELFEGTLTPRSEGSVKYPIVPGHEFTGRVVDFGPNVSHLQEADQVVVQSVQPCDSCAECRRSNWNGCQEKVELGVSGRNGGYSQFVVVPSRFAHRLPPGLDLRKATLSEPMAVILKGLNRVARHLTEEPENRRWAVVGAGSLGHLCAKTLAHWGHRVTVFDRDPVRRSYFDDTEIDTSDDLSRLHEFDLLVELTGDPEALERMLHRSGAGATILLLGLPYAHKPFTFERLVAYDKTVVGSMGSNPAELEQAIQLLPELDLQLFTECVVPLSDYRRAWDLFRQRKHLKVILDIGTEDN